MMYDKNKFLIGVIEAALLQANIIKSVIPSPATEKLESMLRTIKEEYPPTFKGLILGQLITESIQPSEPLYLHIGDDAVFKISLESIKKTETIPDNAKKKWYQF